MSSSVLEQIRSHHVDVESLQQRIVQHLIRAAAAANAQPQPQPQHAYDRLCHEHAARQLMAEWKGKMRRVLSLYTEDEDLMEQQIAAIQADDPWTSFYSALSSLRLHSAASTAAGPSSSSFPPVSSYLPPFTAEEAYGRHLDLTAFHLRYINLPFHTRVDYVAYLSLFSSFTSVSPQRKTKSHQAREYREYLVDLRDYLEGFHRKVRPLVGVERLQAMMREEFDKEWQEQRVPGWFDERKDEAKDDDRQQQTGDSALYCPACRKHFAKDTVFQAHLQGKKHQKAEQERLAAASSSTPSSSTANGAASLACEMAWLEFCIGHWAQLLAPIVQATVAFTQHKQTLTSAELEQEIRASAPSTSSATQSSTAPSSSSMADDEDDAAPIYNPLNLPLGWDGKPIPYWLYKLNGLNQTFTCEICGGYTYAGPKVYREHFSQWRHAWGMRALGLPNVKELWHVTGMNEVKQLWERISKQQQSAQFREEEEEEMEDAEGNVFSKKNYLELKRQGLI